MTRITTLSSHVPVIVVIIISMIFSVFAIRAPKTSGIACGQAAVCSACPVASGGLENAGTFEPAEDADLHRATAGATRSTGAANPSAAAGAAGAAPAPDTTVGAPVAVVAIRAERSSSTPTTAAAALAATATPAALPATTAATAAALASARATAATGQGEWHGRVIDPRQARQTVVAHPTGTAARANYGCTRSGQAAPPAVAARTNNCPASPAIGTCGYAGSAVCHHRTGGSPGPAGATRNRTAP
jgi:pilus assembly protein FimV